MVRPIRALEFRRRSPEKHEFAGISPHNNCTFAQDTLSRFRGQGYTLGAFEFDIQPSAGRSAQTEIRPLAFDHLSDIPAR